MNAETAPSILAVDDTPANLDILVDSLSDEYNISVALDGPSALETIEHMIPDLVLLDIMMPEMDGYQVCQALKQRPAFAEIPVIFLTAKTAPEDIVKAFSVGAADYVTKPFNAAEVRARVKAHLEIKAGRDIIKYKNAEQRELLHVLCHDLANPFTSIIGVLQLLEESPNGFADYAALLMMAARNGMEVINLVREMRAVEEKPLPLQTLGLAKTIDESLALLAQKIDHKNLRIDSKIDPDVYVRAEKTSLVNSVLNNILTNAIKFSYDGDTVTIRATATKDSVIVLIRDTGMGMPPVLVDDLFDISKATSRPGTSGEKGTGFGMPLIRRFMRAYNGKIEVRSWDAAQYADDHGTEITLTFDVGR